MRNVELANVVSQAVTATGTYNLGNIVRNYYFVGNCNVAAYSNGTNAISINKCGYYKVTASLVVSGDAAGIATVYLANNGVIITQAFGSETITTADTELRTITFSTIVRVLPGSTVNLSLVNTGVATTATKVDLIIEKLN